MAGPNDAADFTSSDGDGSEGSVLTKPRPSAPVVPPKKKLRRSSKIALVVIALVTLLEAAGFGGTYLLYSRHYVSTDNAQVDGDKIDINAPATGTLTDWTLNEGSSVRPNQIVGRVRLLGSGGQPQKVIKAPGRGTVAVNNGVEGEYVTAGTELATAYDFSKIYVTARVDENDIDQVHPGQPVDISVDAFPGTPVTGIVQVIQGSSASVFSIYPGPDTDPTNPQKVDQYVPVKIEFTNTNGLALEPGMNVTVHIRKD